MISKQKEAKMRAFSISLMVIASLAQARAEEPADAKPKTVDNCQYSISNGRSVEVPVGESACFRSPPPYTEYYSVLRCFPPLQEIDQVKRGDPRCGDKYED